MSNTQEVKSQSGVRIRDTLILAFALYVFLFSINLLGHAFKLFGEDFADRLLQTTSDPFLGLFIGILSTAIIQSSSTTTSIVVGLVAAGGLSLTNAIPMIMGANIGTTITNTLVSFGHATRRLEFRRAFSAAIVHDLFNVSSVLVLFPIEVIFHPIARAASWLQVGFADLGGMSLFNPLQYIINPVVDSTGSILAPLPYAPIIVAVLSLVLLFTALALLVRSIHKMILGKVEIVIDRYLFGNDFSSLILGLILTAIVQSSSVTTSLIVPLAGAGILTTKQVYPFTLGANIGTTVTAIIAALATGNATAVTVAFSHLFFNIFGILIFYPLRVVPITVANKVGEFAGRSQKHVYFVIGCFLGLYIIPLIAFFAL